MVARTYAAKLDDLFDRVYVHGVAEIARADLLLWHDGQQRVTKKLWKNINNAWVDRCKTEWEYEDNELPQLLCAYNVDTLNYYLIWGGERNKDTGAIDPWFKPLAEAEGTSENDAHS